MGWTGNQDKTLKAPGAVESGATPALLGGSLWSPPAVLGLAAFPNWAVSSADRLFTWRRSRHASASPFFIPAQGISG